MFGIQQANAWNGGGQNLGIRLVKLPMMYTLCERALKKATGPYPDEYDYRRLAVSIRQETSHMVSQLLLRNALRNKEGRGWMALSQANPNLPKDVIQISRKLASEMLPRLRRVDPIRFQTTNDLNGLKLSIVIRFPATTSNGVRTDMKLLVDGPGRACYLHPDVLKYGFVGDVDGDLFFIALDAALRRSPIAAEVKDYYVPRRVTRQNFEGDICLTDIGPAPDPSLWETYKGLVAKEGIGEITNAYYRSIEIASICFQQTVQSRTWFVRRANRPDLLEQLPLACEDPTDFRAFAARAIMDEFTAFYESVFDMRKDMSLFPYINHFLTALRRPDEVKMDFGYLQRMQYNGKPVVLEVLPIIWDECNGRLAEFLQAYPIIQLQFDGKGNTQKRKDRVSDLLDYYDSRLLGDIFEQEFSGNTRTKLALDKA